MRQIMKAFNNNNKLFTSDNFEYVEINKETQYTQKQKKIGRGIKNTITLLNRLEKSFEKSRQYEDKLLKCRMLHTHSRSSDLYNTDESDTRSSKHSNADHFKSFRSVIDVTESWSTMSIVCLQYQYEELSKRYNTLLKTYNDACGSLSSYDDEVLKLRRQVKEAHAEITNTNEAILTIGTKYLSLKQRKLFQKIWYESKIERLKKAIRTILETAERASQDENEKLHDASTLCFLLR